MPDYTPRNQISYPLPDDWVKHGSTKSALADTLKQLAFTADQAVERAGARNSQHVLDELGQVDRRASENTNLISAAHQRIDGLGGRVQDLETLTGVAPGAPTDAAVNLILGTPSSQSRGTLDDLYASRFVTGVRPEDYGAVGDGLTDDTNAFETALAEATGTFPTPIILSPGATYLVTRSLETVGANVTIVCPAEPPATILSPNTTFNPLSINADGPYATTQLASSVTIGTTNWEVDDASQVQPGSLMQVISSKPWYYDPRTQSTDARKAELHVVTRVEGNTIWTRDVANDGYNLSSETVDISFVRPIRVHLSNIRVKGFLPEGSANTIGRDGIVIEGAFEPYLHRVSVENMPAAGMSIRHSYLPLVNGGHVFDANGTSTGYGLQFNGCRNSVARNVLYAGCRRGCDVSGGHIPSINTLIENCVNLGGGNRADGEPYGWGPSHVVGAMNYGFGSHGAADKTIYRGCFTTNVQVPYSLRGGNETIEGATHVGSTRGGFIQLIAGEHLTVRGVRLHGYSHETPKETNPLDGGPGRNNRRPDCFLRVTQNYNRATARVYLDDVDADVQDTFVHFEEGTVFHGEARFTNIRVVFATQAVAAECAFFYHEGPLMGVSERWTVGLLDRRRQGGTAGHTLTKNVNLRYARYIDYESSGPTA